VRVKGRPLFRKSTKTAAGERTLRLPAFVATILPRRAVTHSALKTGYLPAADTALVNLVEEPGVPEQ
jgi:hypothetical protein